jgi:hypothetical protein
VVEEAESNALVVALARRGPYATSVVGELETIRACRRADVPSAQVEELQEGLVLISVDDDVRRIAGAIAPPSLRTLDAIHLATAVSLREDLDALVTYDARLAAAAGDAGLKVLAPS